MSIDTFKNDTLKNRIYDLLTENELYDYISSQEKKEKGIAEETIETLSYDKYIKDAPTVNIKAKKTCDFIFDILALMDMSFSLSDMMEYVPYLKRGVDELCKLLFLLSDEYKNDYESIYKRKNKELDENVPCDKKKEIKAVCQNIFKLTTDVWEVLTMTSHVELNLTRCDLIACIETLDYIIGLEEKISTKRILKTYLSIPKEYIKYVIRGILKKGKKTT